MELLERTKSRADGHKVPLKGLNTHPPFVMMLGENLRRQVKNIKIN